MAFASYQDVKERRDLLSARVGEAGKQLPLDWTNPRIVDRNVLSCTISKLDPRCTGGPKRRFVLWTAITMPNSKNAYFPAGSKGDPFTIKGAVFSPISIPPKTECKFYWDVGCTTQTVERAIAECLDFNDRVIMGPPDAPTGFTINNLQVQHDPAFRKLKGNSKVHLTLSGQLSLSGTTSAHDKRCGRGPSQCPRYGELIPKGSLMVAGKSTYHKQCRKPCADLHLKQDQKPAGYHAESDIQMYAPAQLNWYFAESHRAAEVYGVEHPMAVNAGIMIDLIQHRRAPPGSPLKPWKAAEQSAVFEKEDAETRAKRLVLMKLLVENAEL